MKRFAIVQRDGNGLPADLHSMLRNYHWEQMDQEHILLLADVHITKLDALDQHPAVLLMPSVFSTKSVHEHAHGRDKATHLLPLKDMGLEETHTAMDVAEMAHERFGRKFALDV